MSLVARLASFQDKVFLAAIPEAVNAGPAGEQALLIALATTASEYRTVVIVGALGEAEGPDGPPVLRDIALRSDMSDDTRAAALVALGKKAGVAASDVYTRVLTDPVPSIRRYGLLALAVAGDDRAWDAVVAELQRRLLDSPPHPRYDLSDRTLHLQSEILAAVCYLGRHAACDPERQQIVVRLMRPRWDHLRGAEQRWLTAHWPACDPSSLAAFTRLDPTWLADWIAPLFRARYPQK